MAWWILSNKAGDHLLDNPHLGWARDAWIATRYGTGVAARAVRLSPKDPPDFEVEFWTGGVHRCEAVEVLRPGRKRGDELWQGRAKPWLADKPISFPEEGWIGYAEALAAVDAQIAKKAAKNYDERYVLVVYVNLGFIRNDKAFRTGLAERFRAGHPKFRHLVFLYN